MEGNDTANDRVLGIQRGSRSAESGSTPATAQEGSPPPLDTAFDDDSARERLYSVLVQTRDSTTAMEIADRAGCHPDTARKYLDWFAQLGLALRHDGRPTTYERNEAYFEWRYVTELTAHHTLEDLREHIQSIQDQIATYRETYGADGPSLVDARKAAEEPTAIDAVWSDLANWASLEDELRLHERARQRVTEPPPFEAIQG